MRPAGNEKETPPASLRPEASPKRPGAPDASTPSHSKKPLKPIGPAALKALREAIRSGTYPSDAAVRSGIERLLRRSE